VPIKPSVLPAIIDVKKSRCCQLHGPGAITCRLSLAVQILMGDSLQYLALYTSTGRSVEAGRVAAKDQAIPGGPCSTSFTYTLGFVEEWRGQPDLVSQRWSRNVLLEQHVLALPVSDAATDIACLSPKLLYPLPLMMYCRSLGSLSTGRYSRAA
jgi:hypothetical protein